MTKNHETKRYLPGYRSLQGTINKIAKPLMGKVGRVQGMLLMYWPEIVGHETAEICSPLKLTENRHKQQMVLHLEVLSEHAQTLEYDLPRIREQIALFCGHDAVQAITLKQVTKKSS